MPIGRLSINRFAIAAAVQLGRLINQAVRLEYLRCAGIAMFVLGILSATSTAWAVIVPAGSHTFDGSLPGNAFVNFTGGAGGAFVTSAPPTSTFGVSIDGGVLHQDYPLSALHIDSGFVVTSTFVFDPTNTGTIALGDPIFSSIGPGTFYISDPLGTILGGSFASGTFTSAVGATSGSLSSSNINTLVLTPGAAFTFDTSSVTAIAPSPTGFSISLSSISGGVGVTAPIGPGTTFIPVNLGAFGLSTGSTVVSGTMTVVPEPTSFILAVFGFFGLAAWGWRRRKR